MEEGLEESFATYPAQHKRRYLYACQLSLPSFSAQGLNSATRLEPQLDGTMREMTAADCPLFPDVRNSAAVLVSSCMSKSVSKT